MSSDVRPVTEQTSHFITFIRHAETIANVAHLLQGSTDSPLSVHGQNQVDALCKAIIKGRRGALGGEQKIGSMATSPLLNGVAPTKILSSPLGRTMRLANAIKTAFESSTDAATEAIEIEPIELVARPALEEKSFGKRENCRGGLHVAGFPIGTKPAEDPIQWRKRVREEGNAILQMLKASDDEQPAHLLVITHGLWISCFMDQFLSNGVRVSFADNTGIFTLSLIKDSASLIVICANDTAHLVGLKRQKGGIGSSASDKRQRNLADMWTKR